MNERIRQLAEQAGEIETINVISYDGDTMETVVSTEFNKEKFAELIVRECAQVTFKGTGPRSALNILEHFGVEE